MNLMTIQNIKLREMYFDAVRNGNKIIEGRGQIVNFRSTDTLVIVCTNTEGDVMVNKGTIIAGISKLIPYLGSTELVISGKSYDEAPEVYHNKIDNYTSCFKDRVNSNNRDGLVTIAIHLVQPVRLFISNSQIGYSIPSKQIRYSYSNEYFA